MLKKIIPYLFLAVFAFNISPVHTAETIVISGRKTAQIGQVIKLSGNATAKAEEHTQKRKLKNYSNLYEKETVTTLRKARMEIKLNDETVIQLGPKGKLLLTEFLFKKDDPDCKCTVSLEEGMLRLVGGAAAHLNPKSVSVKTPAATIGIRGTCTRVKFTNDNLVQYCEEGSTTVSNEFGTVNTDAGQACITKVGEAPGKPFKADADFINSLDPMTATVDDGAFSSDYLPVIYLLLALIFAIKAVRAHKKARHHPKRFIWWILARILLLLGLNSLFDIFAMLPGM